MNICRNSAVIRNEVVRLKRTISWLCRAAVAGRVEYTRLFWLTLTHATIATWVIDESTSFKFFQWVEVKPYPRCGLNNANARIITDGQQTAHSTGLVQRRFHFGNLHNTMKRSRDHSHWAVKVTVFMNLITKVILSTGLKTENGSVLLSYKPYAREKDLHNGMDIIFGVRNSNKKTELGRDGRKMLQETFR